MARKRDAAQVGGSSQRNPTNNSTWSEQGEVDGHYLVNMVPSCPEILGRSCSRCNKRSWAMAAAICDTANHAQEPNCVHLSSPSVNFPVRGTISFWFAYWRSFAEADSFGSVSSRSWLDQVDLSRVPSIGTSLEVDGSIQAETPLKMATSFQTARQQLRRWSQTLANFVQVF